MNKSTYNPVKKEASLSLVSTALTDEAMLPCNMQ